MMIHMNWVAAKMISTEKGKERTDHNYASKRPSDVDAD